MSLQTELFCWKVSNSGTWKLWLWESFVSVGNLVNVTWKSGEINTWKFIDGATTAPPHRGYPTVGAALIFYDPIQDATGSNLHLGSRHTDISRFFPGHPRNLSTRPLYQNYVMITLFIILSNLSFYQLQHMLRGTDCVINMFRRPNAILNFTHMNTRKWSQY